MVFIRFPIFDFFMNFIGLGSLRGVILDTLGGIWLPKSHIVGSWESIGILIEFEAISSHWGGDPDGTRTCARVIFE